MPGWLDGPVFSSLSSISLHLMLSHSILDNNYVVVFYCQHWQDTTSSMTYNCVTYNIIHDIQLCHIQHHPWHTTVSHTTSSMTYNCVTYNIIHDIQLCHIQHHPWHTTVSHITSSMTYNCVTYNIIHDIQLCHIQLCHIQQQLQSCRYTFHCMAFITITVIIINAI